MSLYFHKEVEYNMIENILETKAERESNFELLRLVCMFFILILHVNNGGLFKDLGDIGQSIPATVFESFALLLLIVLY
jgi:hypothetical protein